MELTHIALENLSISSQNMRHAKRAPDITDILPSVRKRGILMPLLVRQNGSPTTFEIVAGRRRYFAARTVAEERGTIDPLPCHILGNGDDADALEASLIENMHRVNPDPMTEFETFSKLIRDGKDIAEIAATFGMTSREVEQRMALGNLLPKIRDAYRREELDDDTIQHLTMASKSQQKDWLALFEDKNEHAPMGYQLKQWLFGGRSISTEVALFPLESYPGQIVADLFGDNSYFTDADLFWEKQNETIAAKRDEYLASGWKEVVILETGTMFETWAHAKTGKKKGGKVFIGVSPRGEVSFHEGYVSNKEARRQKNKEADGDGDAAPVPTKPEVSGPMRSYIDLHRHMSVRAALLDAPGVALRLVIVHAMKGSRLWSVSPEPQRTGRKDTDESVADSPAQKEFLARRAAVLAFLGLPEGSGLTACHGDDTAPIFARLMALSDEDAAKVLTFVMADSLEVGSELVDLAGEHLAVNMAATWTPDNVFFDLLRDKRVINTVVADLASKSVADANVSATGKVQKQIIRDCLTGGNGRTKVEGWVPRWMQFPSRCYKSEA